MRVLDEKDLREVSGGLSDTDPWPVPPLVPDVGQHNPWPPPTTNVGEHKPWPPPEEQ
jgi:hypothetical protein